MTSFLEISFTTGLKTRINKDLSILNKINYDKISHIKQHLQDNCSRIIMKMFQKSQYSCSNLLSYKNSNNKILMQSGRLFKVLSMCPSLKYVAFGFSSFEDTFFAWFHKLMTNRKNHEINVFLTQLYQNSLSTCLSVQRVFYVVSLAARYIYNVFYTYTDTVTNSLGIHYLLTSYELMNRDAERHRGIFAGSAFASNKKGTGEQFEDYISLLPKYHTLNHPGGTEERYFRNHKDIQPRPT